MDCCCCSSWFIAVAVITASLFFFSKKDPSKIAGVYCQPGKFYWVKVVVFFLLIKLRKWKDSRDEKKNISNDHTKVETYKAGYGSKSKSSPAEMEKVQPLSDHFQAIDAIYFNGANKEGFSIISGTARRPHGVVNGFIIFRIPDIGTLVSPKFPDTTLFGGSNEFYGAEGICYTPVDPMKKWTLDYKGELKSYNDESQKYTVHLQAEWKSDLEYFDYDHMIPAWTMARSMAKESWSREYFETLKLAHQTHYEQHGNLKGQIEVDGQVHKFDMPSMRDHSYGVKRDWKLLHRYIFHMFSLEDGRRFDIGVVCQPVTCSQLELGYMYDFDGSLYGLEWVDLPLYNLGENGQPPQDYGMRVKATNGKVYYIQVQVLETQELHIGWEWEARIVERRCKFTVDGVDGIGISECQYRHTGGRPEVYSKTDPDWVKTVKTI